MLSIANTVYVQPRFDDFSDYRLLNEFALNIAITKVLSLGSAVSVAYDSEPPDGVLPRDVTFEQTVTLSF